MIVNVKSWYKCWELSDVLYQRKNHFQLRQLYSPLKWKNIAFGNIIIHKALWYILTKDMADIQGLKSIFLSTNLFSFQRSTVNDRFKASSLQMPKTGTSIYKCLFQRQKKLDKEDFAQVRHNPSVLLQKHRNY